MASTSTVHALSARTWPLRVLRSLAAAQLSLVLAVGGHRLGSGEIVTTRILGLVFAVVFATTLLLSARRLTSPQIVGLLLIAQIVVHVGCAGDSMTAFGPAMIAGHLGATVAATWVLVCGERFVWAMADRLGLRALRHASSPLVVIGPVARVRFGRHDIRLPLRLVLVGGKALRGPPVGFA